MASTKTQDAIALLKEDHRKVEELFAQFEKAKGRAQGEARARDLQGAHDPRHDRGGDFLPARRRQGG